MSNTVTSWWPIHASDTVTSLHPIGWCNGCNATGRYMYRRVTPVTHRAQSMERVARNIEPLLPAILLAVSNYRILVGHLISNHKFYFFNSLDGMDYVSVMASMGNRRVT